MTLIRKKDNLVRKAVKIVIALGVIAASDALIFHVVTPRMWRTTIDGVSKVDADIRGIEEALALFQQDCGFYPTDLESLVANKSRDAKCAAYNPDGYLDKVPTDPWGRPYVFLSDGHRYLIESYGADGKKGGRGKDADVESRNF